MNSLDFCGFVGFLRIRRISVNSEDSCVVIPRSMTQVRQVSLNYVHRQYLLYPCASKFLQEAVKPPEETTSEEAKPFQAIDSKVKRKWNGKRVDVSDLKGWTQKAENLVKANRKLPSDCICMMLAQGCG